MPRFTPALPRPLRMRYAWPAHGRAAPRRPVLPERRDWLVAAAVAAVTAALGLLEPGGTDGHRPDALGWTLLAVVALPLAWRRRFPLGALLVVVAAMVPYHLLDNVHTVPSIAAMVMLYSLAVVGPRRRTVILIPSLLVLAALAITFHDPGRTPETMRTAGWILVPPLLGEAVRVHRNYIRAIVERAERAERTREEEAARRVAEERLRIARDLHDLLAHTITLIGVQTSVAAHVLQADPERLDRKAVAQALDGIADTCRDARSELRTTLEVLRAGDQGDGAGPPPGLDGLPDLVAAARAAGADVDLAVPADGRHDSVPAAVGAAAYRIVQQSLTNAVQHAGAGVRICVEVVHDPAAQVLRLTVGDDGGPPAERPVPLDGGRREGYGIVGMRERARTVGGTLAAGPRADGPGFTVRAVLPCTAGPGAGAGADGADAKGSHGRGA